MVRSLLKFRLSFCYLIVKNHYCTENMHSICTHYIKQAEQSFLIVDTTSCVAMMGFGIIRLMNAFQSGIFFLLWSCTYKSSRLLYKLLLGTSIQWNLCISALHLRVTKLVERLLSSWRTRAGSSLLLQFNAHRRTLSVLKISDII